MFIRSSSKNKCTLFCDFFGTFFHKLFSKIIGYYDKIRIPYP
ncbi:hypothetical protein PARMER_04400 [Parabacteroides merdae ATCC 43184]|nr:hypothetical protein PARMER_04400 [Parabacteroides merdae ATCC 43184]